MIERLVRFLPDEIKIYMEWLIHRWSKLKSSHRGLPRPTQACLHMQFLDNPDVPSSFPPVVSPFQHPFVHPHAISGQSVLPYFQQEAQQQSGNFSNVPDHSVQETYRHTNEEMQATPY